ncbi:MAG: phosphoethanolamine transferase [Pseudomonadota bacterium]|nr:phosphoethanolamine transferase [Pseudomonadota bacterium]
MLNFRFAFLYIIVIAYLPLVYTTVKTVSLKKLRDYTFTKLLIKDFIRTIPICALVSLPILVMPDVARPYLMIIQAIFMPLMFMELGHIYLFGTRIGLNTFYSVFVSNIRETREFIGQNIPVILYILAPLFYLIPFIGLYHLPQPAFDNNLVHIAAVTTGLILSIPFIRNLFKKGFKFKDGYILNPFSNLIWHYISYRRHYRDLQQKIATHNAPLFDTITSVLPDKAKGPCRYIIVIGESANSMHFSCYGYPRQTNEFTESEKGLIAFKGVRSQFAQTMPSLEKAISFADTLHPEFVLQKGSLIDYFKQAGFKTYWLSNQYALEDTVITAMTAHADYNKCFNFSGMKRFEKAGLDGDMLPDIEKILSSSDEKQVIFVHLIGSHSAYVNRYPASFRHWTDHLAGKNLSDYGHRLLNSYDDSIRYTDWVLSQIINQLKATDSVSYMLYFSDHGEDIFDTTTNKILGHSQIANKPMTSIPFMLWLSPKLEALRPDIRMRSKHYQSDYKLEDAIHTIIDVSSLTNKDYEPLKSILNPKG